MYKNQLNHSILLPSFSLLREVYILYVFLTISLNVLLLSNIIEICLEVLMWNCFIRNLISFLTAIYIFYKLLNVIPKRKQTQLYTVIFSILSCFLTSTIFVSNQSANWVLLLIILFIVVKHNVKCTFPTTYTTVLFSFSLSFISLTFSGIIISLLLSPLYFRNYEIPWYFARLLAAMVQSILVYSCFRIPRLRKGMNTLYHIPSNNIGSSICIFLFMLWIIYAQLQTYAETFILSFSSLIILTGFLLIYWWNYHITQTYRKYLRRNEIDSLNILLEERNQEILYLKMENDKLAGIIHKDNKIIPSLSMAIIDSYENKTELDLSKLECDSSLYTKLKQLYDERYETLEKYQQEILHLPQTSFDSVNAILSFMQSEALNAGVPYEVVLFDSLDSIIPAEITENDFTHILSDLLENAVNACQDIPSASIQVYLGKMEGISNIKICNTGNVFDVATLKNLGLVRHTTHADTGGSGIGLMDIWKIKEKCKATLLIDEITRASSFEIHTHVNILFNHKNHYIIQSDRHKELSKYINRPDIMIIPKE